MLSRHGVSLEGVANLIVAAFELKEVQLVRDAIRTADIASGRPQPVSKIGPAPDRFERRFHVHPEPKIEPRRHIHPEPRIEPRRVIHPVDRYEPSHNCEPVTVVVECYTPCKKHVIEPPWKVLPWDERNRECPPVGPKVKLVVKPPDIAHKGSLIDFFI